MIADHEQDDPAVAIGTDERRMHVRAYNYWSSLLAGRDFPSIEDLDGRDVSDFADHSLLLDFTASSDNPVTSFIGAALRAECEIGDEVQTIADVPPRSLLSRLTDHWLQIVANRAPIGFEAEFTNQRGHDICYRGILMPFSSDGETIDFIYGVINWKDGIAAPTPVLTLVAEDDVLDLVDGIEPEAEDAPPVLGEDAGLADRLSAARETVEVLKAADGRSRAALYRALSLAYDFAVASRRVPDDYAELLDDAGIKSQARAPMTPIVKLVFGADYDKARLTEFAAALAHAERCEVDFEGFLPFIEQFPGSLKGLVAAERDARRPDRRSDNRADKARVLLRAANAQPLSALAGNDEFTLVLVRRDATGKVEPVCAVPDLNLLEKAFRHLS
ncbi:hypothetical protein GGQ97_000838 [Sphingomonas kaistensis]|uniref:PAS domain-containing protein n=1 Tax=Sphingomonas kaistensis TaxID=298708 RepID=A0A7X6BG37_9SPHN|nr:hypothetical protein [Sphingomonas kaistensis]NJC05045.1 hypothetical protein [Sphingomonas kaistensis]